MVTKGLKLKISALETLYSGQFTLSTQLMKSKYLLLSITSSVQSFSAAADIFFSNPFSASVFNSWRPLTFQCWFSVVEDTPLRMLPGAGRFCYWLSVIWIALIVMERFSIGCHRPKPFKVTALVDWKITTNHRENASGHDTIILRFGFDWLKIFRRITKSSHSI